MLLAGLGLEGLGAGAKGVLNYFKDKDEEEENKKAALRGLANKFLNHKNMMQVETPVPEAPTMAEQVGGSLLKTGIDKLSQGSPKGGEEEIPWYQQAARGFLAG